MTKYEIVSKVAKQSGLTHKQVNACLVAILFVMKTELISDKKISIRGLGAFSVKETKSRKGFNLSTRQQVEIPSRKIVKFKMCQWLFDLNRYF